MKDGERAFHEEVREKSVTARSASKRPRRSGCRLPKRSRKEIEKMNGPTYTVNVKKQIAWDEFKALPEGLKKEYVNYILSNYKVGAKNIADLLGVNSKTLNSALRRMDLHFARGFRPDPKEVARLNADYGVSEVGADAPAKKMALQNLSFCFAGPFDADQFAEQLKHLIPSEQTVKVSVAVEVAQSGPLLPNGLP